MKAAVTSYFDRVRRRIEKAKAEDDTVPVSDAVPEAFNCYDGAYLDSHLTSSYFFAYREGGETKYLYGDFVVELSEDRKIQKIYRTSF